MNLQKMSNFILDLFYPNRCPCCDKFIPYDKYICEECLSTMQNPTDILCKYCGFALEHCKCGQGIYYDRTFTCYTYDGNAKNGVISLKQSNNLNFAYHVGNILSDNIKSNIIKYDLIVPVPMSTRKKLKRGYNQAEVIAKVLSKNLDVPLDSKALKVHYSKSFQHNLSKKERFENAKRLYFEGTSNIKDKYIILVDDVMTTGSTLNVCSNILHGMGAKSVIVAVATSDQLKNPKTD